MSKIIQITSNKNILYGLDENGVLWEFHPYEWSNDTKRSYPNSWMKVIGSPEEQEQPK